MNSGIKESHRLAALYLSMTSLHKHKEEEVLHMKQKVALTAVSPEEQTKASLKGYRRAELLEVILLQSKEIDALKKQTSEMEKELSERRISINEAGNIAEAALKLNHIFQDAELAVLQYKENIERLSKDERAVSRKLVSDAEKKAGDILSKANAEANSMLAQAKIQCDMRKLEADKYWNDLSTRLTALYNEHKGLRELVGKLDDGKARG